jgi:hypothetical protein
MDTEKRAYEANEVFYVHYRARGESGMGSAAVTFAIAKEKGEVPIVGWAFCAPRDQFSRNRGRLIARGRMEPLDEGYQLQGILTPVEAYALCEQIVKGLAEERKQYDRVDHADGDVDPEPRIPRWFVPFAEEVLKEGRKG